MSNNVRVWSDLDNYAAMIVERGEYAINFKIFSSGWLMKDDGSFDEEANDDSEIVGHVKWNGCSNWMTESRNYDIHCCGRDGIANLCKAMERCWDWTAEILPTWDAN